MHLVPLVQQVGEGVHLDVTVRLTCKRNNIAACVFMCLVEVNTHSIAPIYTLPSATTLEKEGEKGKRKRREKEEDGQERERECVCVCV
jgi:hypothetical protein